VISAFGVRSVYNGQPRAPHRGIDFRGATGTPVQAPARGVVVLAEDLYFSGSTVILDHGLGVFSMLCHLSRIDVRQGALVVRGDVLGAIGSTGRVTGPHLHWTLRIGAASVDPLSVLDVAGAGSRSGSHLD
jgi:murein DD-endopeptidase MepM/ murein hydrolase activator NlpD